MTHRTALSLGGLLIASIFLTLGEFMPLTAVYGYGYGTGSTQTASSAPSHTGSSQAALSSIEVKFDNKTVSEKTTKEAKIHLKFDAADGARYMRISKDKDGLDNAGWETFDGDRTVKVRTEAGRKTHYYLQFKDADGNESKVYEKSITYAPKSKDIRMSKKDVSKNEILTQSGKRFSKNSSVALYFSKNNGGYYAPVNVKTNDKGAFSVNYTVKKPKGTYAWYAIDLKTGKKSKTLSYRVTD